jgi:hypothetical protein
MNAIVSRMIYLLVFTAFATDAFINSHSLNLLLGGIGFGATIRDLFVLVFGEDK